MLDISRIKDKKESLNSAFDATETLRVSITSLYSRMEVKKLVLNPEIPEDPVVCRGSGESRQNDDSQKEPAGTQKGFCFHGNSIAGKRRKVQRKGRNALASPWEKVYTFFDRTIG